MSEQETKSIEQVNAPRPPRSRRAKRRGFGCVISVGTATEPRFIVRWFEGGARRQQSGFFTKRSAAEFLARKQVELADGKGRDRSKEALTFGEVGEEWLRLHSKPNVRSHVDNEVRFERHVKGALGGVRLRDLSPVKLLEFRAALQGREDPKLSPQTINHILQLVRAVIRYAIVNEYMTVNPIEKIGRGKYMLRLKRDTIRPPIDRAEDVARLLEWMRKSLPGLFPLYATAIYAGLRKGELLGLRWGDVDFARNFLTVSRSYGGETKSGKGRTVAIPPALRPILAAHNLAAKDKREDAHVFPAEGGGMLPKDTKLTRPLRQACKAIGVKPIRLHDLRHVYASYYLIFGGTLEMLRQNLGHASITTTQRYLHAAEEHRVREAALMRFEASAQSKASGEPSK